MTEKLKSKTSVLADKINQLLDEEYMSDSMLSVFKLHLECERDELMKDQDIALQSMRNLDEDRPVDQLDAATKQEDTEREQTRAAQRKTALRGINNALKKVQQGDYGFCDACGAEIGLKRLVVQPSALMDVDCASFHEKKGQIMTAGSVATLSFS